MTERVRSWHPAVPWLREVYHARFDHAYPMHTHDDWAVMLVDDGAVSYGLGRSEHQATPTTLTILPPGVPHDGRSSDDGKGYRKRVLYLAHGWLPTKAEGRAAGSPTLAGQAPLIAARLVHASLQQPGDLMAAEHWLLAVRDHVLDHLGSPSQGPRDAPLARKLRDMLDDRLTQSFTIAEAAAALGTHPSHLVRVFSATYGIAPHQYMIGRRVDLARRLLGNGQRPADVAAAAGFHDQAHLSRHFRRMLGVTPRAFAAWPADKHQLTVKPGPHTGEAPRREVTTNPPDDSPLEAAGRGSFRRGDDPIDRSTSSTSPPRSSRKFGPLERSFECPRKESFDGTYRG